MVRRTILSSGRSGIAASEDDDVREAKISLAFREAGAFLLALFGSWLAINHAAFYTFPLDFAKRADVDILTYLFLAVILDIGLHVAVALLRPSRRDMRRGRGVSARSSEIRVRPELARRPPRAALAESQPRDAESVLALRRALVAAQQQFDETAAQSALEDLAASLVPENAEVDILDLPPPELDHALKPLPVERVARPGLGRGLRTPSPWETPTAPRSRPGERFRRGP